MSRIKKFDLFKSLPIITLVIMIIFTTFMSVKFVYAGGSLKECDDNWDQYNNKIEASLDDTYPFNSTTATITSLSMDVMYGTTRNLVFYHGELPYDCIYDEDDDYVEDWEGYYADPGTSATGNNPSYGASTTPTADEFWGTGLDDSSFSNPATAEQINGSNIVSLRLLALADTQKGFWMILGTALYLVVRFFAWFAVLIISLIVKAKNLSMDLIMDMLNLDDLNDVLTKNFIYNGDTFSLSPFTAFCIIALMLSLVAFTIRWVKGSDKTKGIWEIIGTALLGLLIIGMCLTGRISSLGQSVSTMANNVLYTVANSLNGGGGKAFNIEIKDPGNETEITQMCEMSLVNKAFIDLQLCSQFNVSKVDQLNFSKFGDPNGTVAKQYLSGVTNANMSNDFNNNLGYYFWFANSSAKEKTSLNKTYPETDTLSVTNKLSSMMTYLQKQYNANSSNPEISSLIIKITRSLANPTGGPRFICLLVFAVALILMAIVLLKYALNVVIAKLELFIALLGMILAGPLMLTSNKKLVQAGKSILGMLVVSFLEITIYSVIFDVIIYAVSSMFKPEVIPLLAIIGLLLLLLKFNPIIADYIKRIMEQTERKISPELVNSKRALKNYARNKSNEAMQRYDNSRKVVGYDADRKAITEARKGDALSRLMHRGSNALLTDGQQHEGSHKINRELKDARKGNKADTAAKIREAAVKKVDKELDAQKSEATLLENQTKAAYNSNLAEVGELDSNGNFVAYNDQKLTQAEKDMKQNMEDLDQELSDLQNSEKYKKLVAEQEHVRTRNAEREALGQEQIKMDEKRAQDLAMMKMKISAKKKQIENEKAKIDSSIKERAAKEAMEASGMTYDKSKGVESINSQIENSSKQIALENHRESLETTLKESIAAVSAEVNDTHLNKNNSGGKIGSKEAGYKLNREAATQQAAMMLQLDQLQNGEEVMDTESAQNEVEHIVENVAKKYEKESHSTAKQNYETTKDNYHNNTKFGSASHKQARQDMKDAKDAYKDDKMQYKTEKKEVKETLKDEGVGRTESASSVLQAAIKNRDKSAAFATKSSINASKSAPNMSEVVNNHTSSNNRSQVDVKPNVTQVETRQAVSRHANVQRDISSRTVSREPQPDMSSIINAREEASRQVHQEIPTHNRTDSRHSYEQDEAKRMQRKQDEDFWSTDSKNRRQGPIRRNQ